MIPFLDVKAAYTELRDTIDQAVRRVMDSGWYVLGPEVAAFEQDYAAWIGTRHCIGVANGLDAIALALRAVGVEPGDEVIVPSNTYIATWLAVTMVGGVPVPVEPDAKTHCLDPTLTEAAITSRTRAVLPVHLYGHPADMPAFQDICHRRGLKLIEDGAQAHGAALEGKRIGGHGDAVAWSFYPGKNLGAYGDGGAVTTNDPDVARRVALMRNYGSAVKYVNDIQGVNSRLDPIQAAVLRAKLPVLADWNARRARIASIYAAGLAESSLGLPSAGPGVQHAWHLYVIMHPRRDDLQLALRQAGVETLIHYPIPPFLQKAYAGVAKNADRWPLAARLAGQVLSLPMGPHLKEEDATSVVAIVLAALASLPK